MNLLLVTWMWLLVVLALVVIVVIRFVGSPRERLMEPQCGQCGYQVKGLPGWTCPECGSDLREVGILRQKPKRIWGVHLVAWLAAGSLLLVTLGLIRDVTPVRREYTHTRTFEEPVSGGYTEITLNASGQTWGAKVQRVEVVMTLVRADKTSGRPLRLVSEELIREMDTGRPLSEELIRGWMKESGVAEGNATTEAIGSLILGVRDAAWPTDLPLQMTTSSTESGEGLGFGMENVSHSYHARPEPVHVRMLQLGWATVLIGVLVWAKQMKNEPARRPAAV